MATLSTLAIEPLDGQFRNGEQLYRLTQPLVWADPDWTGPSGGMVETVPVGYVTDFATMPWSAIPWPVVPALAAAGLALALFVSPWFALLTVFAAWAVAISLMFPVRGKWDAATVLHDHMVELHDRPRTEADQIFAKVMKFSGVPAWKAGMMVWAIEFGRKIKGA